MTPLCTDITGWGHNGGLCGRHLIQKNAGEGEGGRGGSQRDDVSTAAAGTTGKQLNDTFTPVRSSALLITSVLEDLFHRLLD